MADTVQTADDSEIRTVTLSPWAGTRVTAVIGFAIGVAAVLIFLLTGGGQALMHRTVIVHTYFSDGTGLIRTATVELNGIKVGKVKSVSLSRFSDAARAVQVDMRIRRDFLGVIPIDSKTELTADTLLGDKYINITKGASSKTIEAGAELATQPPSGNFDPADLLRSLQDILKSVTALLTEIEDPATPLGSFINGEDYYQQLLGDVSGIQAVIHKYANPRNHLGQAIYGQQLYQEMQARLMDIDKQVAAIQANPMLANTTQYDAWLAQTRSLHAAVDGIRKTPLLNEDDLYRSSVLILRNLNETVGSLAASQWITSAETFESLNGASRNARVFIHDFRGNPQKYLRIKIF